MSPLKQMKAGFASAIAWTSVLRTSGSAGAVSLGSWNRVSPYATNRKGGLISNCRAAGDVWAWDLLVQATAASNAEIRKANRRGLIEGMRIVVFQSECEDKNLFSHEPGIRFGCRRKYDGRGAKR